MQPFNPPRSVLAAFLDGGRALADLVAPPRCAFCGYPPGRPEWRICAGCFGELPWNRPSCARCAMPLAQAAAACGGCQRDPPPFFRAVAPLRYEYPVDAAIKAFKFRRKLCYQPAFSMLMLDALLDSGMSADALLPVPLHWRRHAFRGFNQAFELARPLARSLGLPILGNVVRRRATPPQSGLEAAERRRNLRQAFAVCGSIDAQRVIIVDDVITTGETCRQLARLLEAEGVREVSVLALARA